MAELKTKPTNQSVIQFIESISDATKRDDCMTIHNMMTEISHTAPKMWGTNIIGYDLYSYEYASGRKGEWFIIGFSPRVSALTLYLMSGYEHFPETLSKLGKYKVGKSCLYIKKLSDINIEALKELITKSYLHLKKGDKPQY